MKNIELHDFLFQLYNFADLLADKIESGDVNANYFLTLIYVEQIMDTYGRGMIMETAASASNPTIDSHTSLSNAHKKIDLLRGRIRSLVQNNDFDESIKAAGIKMFNEWHKQASEK